MKYLLILLLFIGCNESDMGSTNNGETIGTTDSSIYYSGVRKIKEDFNVNIERDFELLLKDSVVAYYYNLSGRPQISGDEFLGHNAMTCTVLGIRINRKITDIKELRKILLREFGVYSELMKVEGK